MSKKQVIAVDIDEVLMPHFVDLITWYNAKFGTTLTEYDNHPTDPGNWGTDDVTVAIKRVHQFYDTQEFMDSKPFKEARKELEFLGSYYDLIVVTARDTILEAATTDWISRHFKELFQSIHFTKHFNFEGQRRDKVEVLRELNVSYFIDDSLANIDLAAAAGIQSVLFGDYAWNQADVLPKNVTRCKNWLEVSDYFEDILSARLVDSQIKRPTISHEELVAKLKRDGLL